MGIAWDKIVEDGAARRLDLRTSESALAQKKAAEAGETVQTRLKEAWCYLIVPHQSSLQSDVSFHASRTYPLPRRCAQPRQQEAGGR